MKTTFKLFAVALTLFGMAACEKEKPKADPVVTDIKITTAAVTNIQGSSAVGGGEITSDGGNTITARGVCYGKNTNPDIKGAHTSDGSGIGAFESSLTDLEPATKYYVRAYASCKAGVAYGNEVTFTVPASIPVVETGVSSNITINSFDIAGKVLSEMGAAVTEVGVCYGTEANPTKEVAAAAVATNFSVTVTGLVPNVKYYVRAYAKNEKGTGYGEDIEVTTSDDPIITVPDEALQALLEYEFGDTEGNVHKSVADNIKVIIASNQGIKSIEGIKQFPALTKLVIDHNSISHIDVSGMTNLDTLNVGFNAVGIRSLNVDGCTALKYLNATDPGEDGTSPATFAPNAPALEEVNINLWRTTTTVDVSKCPKLKRFDACQMYKVESLDFTYSNVLEHLWVPDIFVATSFKVKSPVLDYLGMWNSKALVSLDLSECPKLREIVANDCEELTEIKINSGENLKILNLNCCRKLKALDISTCVNAENLNIIQLYECETLKLPTDLSHLKLIWAADALKITELTFNNVPANARVAIWNCPALTTFNYKSAQRVIGWNYDLGPEGNPDVVTDVWTVPGNNITTFNIDAPNCEVLFCSNLHKFTGILDLTKCPELRELTAPDYWVATGIDLSACTKLHRVLMWNWHVITSVDFSKCAETMSEVNVGTGDGKCKLLETIYLRSGQTITTLIKEPTVNVVIK